MMYVGETPWHGEGEYVGDENVYSAEALKKSGLDWTVEKRPMYVGETPVPEHRAIVRSTDEKILGVVGHKYQPLQNVEAFSLLDRLVSDGEMKYHTAGALDGGKRVWILGQIHGNIEPLPGDVINKFILLSNSHDGSGAVRVIPTAVRVVCKNTLGLALKGKRSEGVYVKHTRNMEGRLDKASEILELANASLNEYGEFAKALTKIKFSNDQAYEFFGRLTGDIDDNRKHRRPYRKDKLMELFNIGTGQDIRGVHHTGWAVHNAVTEFTNYYRGTTAKNPERRHNFDATIFGPGADFINKADSMLKDELRKNGVLVPA